MACGACGSNAGHPARCPESCSHVNRSASPVPSSILETCPQRQPWAPKPTAYVPCNANTLQLSRDGTHFFCEGGLCAPSHVHVCPSEPQHRPLVVVAARARWKARPFLPRHVEHAAFILDTLRGAPRVAWEHKLHPSIPPPWPLPTLEEGQLTLTLMQRHRRPSLLLEFAPPPKHPRSTLCPITLAPRLPNLDSST